MEKGDALIVYGQVAAGSAATFRPSANNEAILHNITCQAEITVRWTNGVNTLNIVNLTPDPTVLSYYDFHVTNDVWIEVVNEDAAAKWICLDGIVSK